MSEQNVTPHGRELLVFLFFTIVLAPLLSIAIVRIGGES